MAPRTVQLIRTNTTLDQFGDGTETPARRSVPGALFVPNAPQERAGETQVKVVQTGHWNLPGCHQLNADDLIRDGNVDWQVVGGGTVLVDRTKVPVQRARKR